MSKAADPLWDWPAAPAAALMAQGGAGDADANMGAEGDKAGDREVERLASTSRVAAAGVGDGVGCHQGGKHMLVSALLGAFASLQSAASASAPHAPPQEVPSGPDWGDSIEEQPAYAWDGPWRAGGMPCIVLPYQIHRRSLSSRR